MATGQPLIAIVGPTASGKTGLAIRLAKEIVGEIISADSRAVYKGLSIGTAKPNLSEQQGVPHWGIDIATPGERFTAADFQRYARMAIADIRSRGNIPILVGGTGLYIDSVLYDFEFPTTGQDTKRRDALLLKSVEELHEYCKKYSVELPENKMNKRHVVNAILRNNQPLKRKHELEKEIVVVGIATENEILKTKIKERAKAIFNDGVINEAVKVAEKYGWENEAMTGNIYPLIKLYKEGKITRAELEEKSAVKDWQLAKRQLTWFRRNEHIHWGSADELYTYVTRRLDKVNNL